MLLFDSKTNPEDRPFVEVYTVPGSNLEKELVCFENYEDLAKNFSPAELERLKHHGLAPGKVKAQKVWTSKGMMFYKPYLGDNDVKKTEVIQKSSNQEYSRRNSEPINSDDSYDLDLEGNDKNLWKYSYLKNKKKEENSDILDLIDYKIHKLLNEHKLYYDPDRGFVRNARLIEGDRKSPLLRSEKHSYPLKLSHYSRHAGLREINPNFMSSKEKTNTSTFHIEDLSKDSIDKPTSKYTIHLEPHHKLYDLDSDKDRLVEDGLQENGNIWDTDKILNKIRDSGYHGIWAPESENQKIKNIVQLFYSHKPEIEEVL